MSATHLFLLHPTGQLDPLPTPTGGLDAVSASLPEGIYTTFRTYPDMRVVGLTAHLERLPDSHRLLNDSRPIDLAHIRQGVLHCLTQTGLTEAKVRITTPLSSPLVYINIEALIPWPAENYQHGVVCETTLLPRPTPKAKTTAFIAPSRAEKALQDPTIHELIRVDASGYLLEGLTSNFFAVLNGTLRTAEAEVLAGVTRQAVLAAAEGLLPVTLTPIHLNEIAQLSEAFITSASRAVMPIARLNTQVLPAAPGPITTELARRYHANLLTHAETL